MPVKMNTFSDVQNDVATYDQAQTTQPATTATPVVDTAQPATAIPATDTTIVQAVDAAVPAAQPAAETEDNSSDFNLSLGSDPAPAQAGQPAQPAPTAYNWKDEIKKLDKKEVAKELGLNDFAIELNDHLLKGGNAIDYINAKAIDYNTVPDEDLVKEDFRKQFPTFTKDEINRLFNRKYGVTDEMTDEEKGDRFLELKADAHTRRQSKIEEQKKFKVPDAISVQDESYEQWKQQKISQSQNEENTTNYVLSHEATKNLNESKRVAINLGEGVKPYNFKIDQPEMINKVILDAGAWQKLTSTQTGEPDVQKQQLIALFAFNPQKFMQDIFSYGQQQGVKNKIVTEGQNAQRPQAIVATMPNEKPTYGQGKFGDKQRQ